METLRQMILSIFITALIGGILVCVIQEDTYRWWLRMICGSSILIIILTSVNRESFEMNFLSANQISEAAQMHIQQGEKLTEEQTAKHISDGLESYIVKKATDHGMLLEVSVTLGENRIPEYVEIKTDAPVLQKEELSEMLTNDLGIAKENQQWTGLTAKTE